MRPAVRQQGQRAGLRGAWAAGGLQAAQPEHTLGSSLWPSLREGRTPHQQTCPKGASPAPQGQDKSNPRDDGGVTSGNRVSAMPPSKQNRTKENKKVATLLDFTGMKTCILQNSKPEAYIRFTFLCFATRFAFRYFHRVWE